MADVETASHRFVEPMILKGFRDYLPDAMISQNQVVQTIRTVFEKYGFVPIDTPVLEYLVTLIGTGGEEVTKNLFRLESPENEPVAMRYDLTVPFARVIAQYPDKITMPFRRYHIGPVFRAEKPEKDRLRQFTQFDIDAAGSSSVVVDAEIIAAMCEALAALGLTNDPSLAPQQQEFQVRINNRKLVDALLDVCGVDHEKLMIPVLRVIDKLQKVGLQNIRKELGEGRIDDSGDPIKGVGLEESVVEQILDFIAIRGDSRSEILEAIARTLSVTELGRKAVEEMEELRQALDALSVSETEAVFDPSLTRGLDYYTGPVFEAFLPFSKSNVSVMGGGRFDDLVSRFLDTSIPSTGASIGLDRLMNALIATKKLRIRMTTTKVLILAMKDVPTIELVSIAQELRRRDVPTEVFMSDSGESMRDQLSFANSKDIQLAIIVGPDEIKAGTVSVKNLSAGKKAREGIKEHKDYVKAGRAAQVTVQREQLVETVLEMIG